MRSTTLSLRTLALLGAGFTLLPQVAMAQDSDDDTDTVVQETVTVVEEDDTADQTPARGIDSLNTIIVTGTKTQNPENVQDIPLAVTAFNSESLDALNVRDVQSLTYSAPNVSLDQVGTSRGTANFSIRGLGINSSIPSIDPTVGLTYLPEAFFILTMVRWFAMTYAVDT